MSLQWMSFPGERAGGCPSDRAVQPQLLLGSLAGTAMAISTISNKKSNERATMPILLSDNPPIERHRRTVLLLCENNDFAVIIAFIFYILPPLALDYLYNLSRLSSKNCKRYQTGENFLERQHPPEVFSQ
jgi:hypothetical protein